MHKSLYSAQKVPLGGFRGLLLFLFLLYFGLINAQTILINDIPRDTSYTVYSSFIKEKKNFPFIQVVDTKSDDLNSYFNISYKTISPNRELKLNIFRPKTNEILPAVLMIHGGGWNSGSPDLQKALALNLARKGFVTITAEFTAGMQYS